MEDELNVGDVVQLKSGGPDMTIEHIGVYGMASASDHQQAKCVWFEKMKRHDGLFELHTLCKATSRTVRTGTFSRG